MQTANKKCINPDCGSTFDISTGNYLITCGYLLDVQYHNPPKRGRLVDFMRGEIMEEIYTTKVECGDSEILINFVNIDCEDFTQCASYLVSLDGFEGRLSKPYKMSKVVEYADINIDSLLL